MSWQKLPVEGLTVEEIIVFGNGKDCEVTITTRNPKKTVSFTMRDPTVKIRLQGKVDTMVFSDGSDTRLGVKYIPLEEQTLENGSIDYPGDEQEWRAELINFENGRRDFIGWTIYHAKLELRSSFDSDRQKTE